METGPSAERPSTPAWLGVQAPGSGSPADFAELFGSGLSVFLFFFLGRAVQAKFKARLARENGAFTQQDRGEGLEAGSLLSPLPPERGPNPRGGRGGGGE